MKPISVGLIIGIGIGAAIFGLPLAFLTVSKQSTNGQDGDIVATFSLEGYLRKVTPDSITMSQCKLDACFENSEVMQQDIHITMTNGTTLYNCGNTGENSVDDCAEAFDAGNVPVGSAICAGVRLIDGELHGAKVFFNLDQVGCDFPPRI